VNEERNLLARLARDRSNSPGERTEPGFEIEKIVKARVSGDRVFRQLRRLKIKLIIAFRRLAALGSG
jgi:hypothetical protein